MYINRLKQYLSKRMRGQPNPFKVRWVPPEKIKYTTPPSEFTDLNQHDANRDHPHAYYNRGYFKETKRLGTVLGGDWDDPNLKFETLLEYKAIKKHIDGKQDWKDSKFAKRGEDFIKSGGTSKGFEDPREFLIKREKQVERLIESIKENGVQSSADHMFNKRADDQISVNVSRNGELLFNNRGTHRLSIAKILNLDTIPIVVVIWHKEWIEDHGFTIPCER